MKEAVQFPQKRVLTTTLKMERMIKEKIKIKRRIDVVFVARKWG